MVEPISVTLDVAAVITGDTRSHMFELCRTGELPSFKDGRRRKVLLVQLIRRWNAGTMPAEDLARVGNTLRIL